jgi:uncharacterized protein (UPF0333 family)
MRSLIFIVFLVAAAGMMAYLMKTRNETSVTSTDLNNAKLKDVPAVMKNKVQENIQNPEHLKDMPEGDEDKN